MLRSFPAVLVAFSVLVSCGTGNERPARRPEPPSLRVLHTSPTGTVEGRGEIHVVFDRPVVPEGMREARPGTLLVQPPVPGTLHGVGLSAIAFVPDAPLPPSTRFRVEIPEGTLANDGTLLRNPVVFHFETPRLRVIDSLPRRLTALRNDQPFLFKFDQTVEAPELARRARFVVGNQNVPAVAVTDPADPEYLRVTPGRPLPNGAGVELVIDAALVGTQGPLPMGRPIRVAFTVHGRPGIASVACRSPRCTEARVALSTPLPRDAVTRMLRVEPAATVRLPEDEPRVSELTLADLRPSTRYRVVLASGITDIFGQALAQDSVAGLAVPALPSEVRPAFVGSVLVPGSARELPFSAVNLERATLRIDRVNAQQIPGTFRTEDPLPGQLAYAPATTVAFGPARDVVQSATAALARVVGAGPGVFGLALEEGDSAISPLIATDLDLAARWSERGGIVWASSMATGAPLRGARVEVRDERGRMRVALETDGQGIARLPASIVRAGMGSNELFVVGSRDGDLSFVRGPVARIGGTPRASLFTDQTVYRRGDVIRAVGVLSRRHPIAPGSVSVRVSGAGGTFGATQTAATGAGTFAADLEVPEWAAYGTYRVEAVGGASAWTAAQTIEVRPPAGATPEVDVELGRDLYVAGQTAVWQVRAHHPVRGNLAGAVVEWRAVGRAGPFAPHGWDDFHFGPARRVVPAPARVLAHGNGTLDGSGSLADSVRLESAGIDGAQATPMRVRIEANVGGAGVGVAEAWTHPAGVYVGLRLPQLASPDGAVLVEVASAQPSGKAVRMPVEVEAQRVRFEGARSTEEGRAIRCRASTNEQGRGSCRLSLRQPGVYLVTASASDGRGYRSVSSVYTLRAGRAEIGDAVPADAALAAPSSPQTVGQTARLLVASPFDEARALVLVGPEGTDASVVTTVPRGITAVDVPVTDSMRPSVPVHLYLAGSRGRVVEADARLVISSADRALRVSVAPDAENKAPGDRLELRVRVATTDDAPVGSANLVLAVQDESGATVDVDPLSLQYPPVAPAVMWAALRPAVVRAAPPASAPNGPAVNEPAGPAAREGRTVYWNSNVLTDTDGTAVVRLDLPAQPARYRIVAIALDPGGRSGTGAASVSTSAPIRLEPRVVERLRVGDETSAIVTVVNDTRATVPMDLVAESAGLGFTTAGAQHVDVLGSSTADVRLDVRAVQPGPATLMLRASAGNRTVVATPRLDVLAAGEEEVATRSGRVGPAPVPVTLTVPPDASTDAGGVAYTLSLQPAAAALSIAESSLVPRRQDTASLLESLVARAFLARNAERLGGTLPSDNVEHAAELARSIGLRIAGGGGVRHFRGGPPQVPLGGWVGVSFGYARRAGIAVPRRTAPVSFPAEDAALVGWARKLQALPPARMPAERDGGPPEVTDAALRLLTSPGDDRAMLEGVLVSATHADPDDAGIAVVRPTPAERARGITAVRATALAVLARLEGRSDEPTESLVRGLLSLRSAGRYQAPLDTVAALIAFDRSLERSPVDRRARVSASVLVGGSPAAAADLVAGTSVARGDIPLSVLLAGHSGAVEVRRRGTAAVFFDLVARFRRLAPTDEPAEHGLAVERVYERLLDASAGSQSDPDTMPDRTDRQFGTDGAIRVHIRLANGVARRNVVLVDELPAGCTRVVEAAPSVALGPFVPVETAPPSRGELYAAELPPGIFHLSYLVRPSFPGRFFAPGTLVELLDDPTVWGRSAGDVIAVEGH